MLHESTLPAAATSLGAHAARADAARTRGPSPRLQHSGVLLAWPGTRLLFIFGCDVTVCSVRCNVLLGMDFFQVKLLIQQDFQVIQKYPSFHYFSIMFENRICTALF